MSFGITVHIKTISKITLAILSSTGNIFLTVIETTVLLIRPVSCWLLVICFITVNFQLDIKVPCENNARHFKKNPFFRKFNICNKGKFEIKIRINFNLKTFYNKF